MLVISGEGGHSNEVLSLGAHPWNQHRFLSGGMDSMVKIWSLEGVLKHKCVCVCAPVCMCVCVRTCACLSTKHDLKGDIEIPFVLLNTTASEVSR